MRNLRRAAIFLAAIFIAAALFSQTDKDGITVGDDKQPKAEASLAAAIEEAEDNSVRPDTILRLTETDFQEVAKKLGVEVAAIKAVVDIEAGPTHQGFAAPGQPLVNFDLTMFRKFAAKRGVNLSKYSKSHSPVFSPSRGSQSRAYNRVNSARTINPNAAIEGTFWGMFQIGGFNYDKCGTSSLEEFETLMSRSERDQLDMFANFITSTGLVKYLRSHDWASFARGYNGPGYAARNYHTRMASAYARHKAKSK
ncbi:MAG: N-acetylmuramidase family protein [Duncaniella sp.]|nr:N-acetylmuramidase family protein [Duncaniella sp.]